MRQVEPRPGGLAARPRTDAALRRFARFVLGFLFREVALLGAERLPEEGGAIVIANHTNSLVDGGVLLGFLPRPPRFLAASTVWDYKPVAPFMNASGSVKVFRQQDGRAHEGSLEDSFADAVRLLADGGVLAVFPEGRTHDAPALLPFKTGTARIAQLAAARHGPLDLAIVPVGIDYETKNRVRTRVCFTFGDPVRLEPGTQAAPGENPGADRRGAEGSQTVAVRAATTRLASALAAVAPDFQTGEILRAMTLAGEILALVPGERPGHPPPFARIVARRHAVEAALAGGTPERVDTVSAALGAYAEGLAAARLADHHLAAPPERSALLRSALALLPALPVLCLAAVLSLPQALLLGAVARTKPRDRQLTWITFGGLTVYPLTWALWALVLGLVAGAALGTGWGWAAAGLTLVAAPLSARLALPGLDRATRLVGALRARRLVQRDPDRAAALVGMRARARAVLEPLFAGSGGQG